MVKTYRGQVRSNSDNNPPRPNPNEPKPEDEDGPGGPLTTPWGDKP